MKKIILTLVLVIGSFGLTACCGSDTGCSGTSSYSTNGCCGDTSW